MGYSVFVPKKLNEDDGYFRLSDSEEVFELRSPQKRNSHVDINAVLVGDTDRYIVRLGDNSLFYGEGYSLAEALHQLANKVDASGIHGSDKMRSETLTGNDLKPCEYCGGLLFFALTPKGKWLPVDSQSIPAGEAGGLRVFSIFERGNQKHVLFGGKPQGEAWFAHPEVCGIKDQPPSSRKLKGRWEINRQKALKKQTVAVQGLQDILHDLEENEDGSATHLD